MPKGKRQYSRPSAGGIVRNDYHRRNRKRAASMFCTSHGYNAPARSLTDYLPRFNLDALIKAAVAEEERRTECRRGEVNVKRACVNYLRHACSSYEGYLRAERRTRYSSQGSAWLSVSEHILKEIAETYPWLSDECERQLAHRRTVLSGTRVVKKAEWRSLSIQHFNEQQSRQRDEARRIEVYTDDEETLDFFRSLTSLDAARFLYLPPFLKRDEVRRRRFGGEIGMNDRWWEWETELGLEALEGRPNARNAQQ